ncbi:glycosyl transferase family 2 [Spirochaetia bacterium]|nr:glycosyl transferase family 2 [Spirochaetia bacterium]
MITAAISITNTPKQQLYRLLECIKMADIDFVYVVDNSYNDYYRIVEKEFENIRYIYSENFGYGANHNIALRAALDVGSDFHIILNPDIYFEPDVIPSLLHYMNENDNTVYILPKVLYQDGEIQYLCKLLPTPFDLLARRFLPNKSIFKQLNEKYCLKSFGYNKEINPPCLSGCFMFLRMSAIKEYNIFFDEQYFLYCEDFDFIRRLHRIGKTIYYPNVSIIHDHAKQSYKSRKWLFVHIKSVITYFNKWGWFFDIERKNMNRQILNELKEI